MARALETKMMTNDPHVEQLENRRLLTVMPPGFALNILGTRGDDVISLSLVADNPHLLKVTVNGQRSYFDLGRAQSISVHALGGNDHFFVHNGSYISFP